MGMVELALIGKLKKTKADKVYVDNLIAGALTYYADGTPPTTPHAGTIWFNTDTGFTYLYQIDSVGNYAWLQLGGGLVDTGTSTGGGAVPVLSESNVIVVTNTSTTTYGFIYEPNFIQVYINRLKLRKSEFAAINGTSITLYVSLEVGDEIEFVTIEGL